LLTVSLTKRRIYCSRSYSRSAKYHCSATVMEPYRIRRCGWERPHTHVAAAANSLSSNWR